MHIVDLESKMLGLYRETSSVCLRDYHGLMRSYRDLLVSVVEKRDDKSKRRREFLQRSSRLGLRTGNFIYPDSQIVSDYLNGYAKHNLGMDVISNIVLWKRKNESVTAPNRLIVSKLMRFGDVPSTFGCDDYLFNQVFSGEDPKNMRYNVGFTTRTDFNSLSRLTSGLPFREISFDEEFFKNTEDPCMVVVDDFPRDSYFISALFNRVDKKIIKFTRRLD